MYIIDLDSSEVILVDKFEITGDPISSRRRIIDMETADGPARPIPDEDIESYRDEDM